MTALEDVIFISLQDGYYNISLYYPNENINGVEFIKSGEPFTYNYDGVTFKIFEKYSSNNYAITDVYAFEQQMNNFPPYLYKFEYEELAYLAIREIFKISLTKYKEILEQKLNKYKKIIETSSEEYRKIFEISLEEYNKIFNDSVEKYNKIAPNKEKIPLFKIVYSDCYKSIQHKKKCLCEYFNVAIAQNVTFFEINPNNLTIDFASNVYPYLLYERTIYVGMGAPLKLTQEFRHCIFDIGYTKITCYIYHFETKEMKEKLTKLIQSEERSVIKSHKLERVSVIPLGLFSFTSSIYYELIEKNKSKMIRSNSSYDYDDAVQKLIPKTISGLPSFYQSKNVNFEYSGYDNHVINKEAFFNTSIIKNIAESISNTITSFNINSCHINSIIGFRWFFEQFLKLKLEIFETNGYDKLLIDSLCYRYVIINNLRYKVDKLQKLPKEFKLNNDDKIIYEGTEIKFCRKRTSMFPDLQINTKTDEFKLKQIVNIDDYIQLGDYVDELNEKNKEILRIKAKYQNIYKKKLEKKYDKKLVNGMYNKLLMLAMNEPTLLEKYVDDFDEKPETYL